MGRVGTAVFAALLAQAAVWANELNMPPGYAGAPGDAGSCAVCHTSIPNSRQGRVSVDFGTLLTYNPGVRQQVTVRVEPGLISFPASGFQATARTASNTTAGTLTPGPERTSVQTLNNFEYVSHTQSSTDRTYTFFWTPPATNAGDIRFYFSAVAGPRDGAANAIDEVYNATFTLRPFSGSTPSGYRWQYIDVPGAVRSEGTAISNDGRLVGTWFAAGRTRGFLRNTDGSITLIDVPQAQNTFPAAVNASGAIVGSFDSGAGTRRGFLRRPDGSFATFESGNVQTSINAMNDAGEMYGSIVTGGITVGVRLNANLTVAQNLGRVPTGVNTARTLTGVIPDLSGLGTAQGFLQTQDGYSQVFPPPCTRNETTVLGALGLNDAADIAGGCSGLNGSVPFRIPFVRLSDSRVVNLNTTGGAGITGPLAARGINNLGQVAATGTPLNASESRAMLLTQCPATVNQTSFAAPSSGSAFNVSVTAATDCNWLAVTDSDWVVPAVTGAGNGNLSVGVSPNPTGVARTARLTVGGNLITITQDATPCSFLLSSTTLTLGSVGGTGLVTVTTTSGCAWTAAPSVPWITITGGSPFTGTGTFSFSVGVNPGTTVRAGVINVGNQQFLVSQAGSTGCSFQVTATSTSAFPATGGTGQVNVVTGEFCSWISSSGSTFITIDGNPRTGSGSIPFNVAANPDLSDRFGSITVAGQTFSVVQQGTGSAPLGLRFVPLTPCRLADTRTGNGKTGSFGPPRLAGGSAREFPIPQGGCGAPSNARAYALNITAVPPGFLGFLTTWPTGLPQPFVSTLNSWNGRVVANAAIVPAGTNGSISVFVSHDTDAVIDINGYFVPLDTPAALAFYPLAAPCRIADTRLPTFAAGNGQPRLSAGVPRNFNMAGSGCNLPSTAQALSLNVTAVPPGALAFLTLWPAGQTQPVVSTLNSFDGQVVPNAAIVPVGTAGAITAFASNDTDVVIDVNGYFAPPGGVGALNFQTVTPCRVADTRPDGGKTGNYGPPRLPAGGSRDMNIPNAGCGVPSTAQAFSLNITAVPPGFLGFVTAWPAGLSQPFVSNLNSWNGQVVANAAIVPGGNGSISLFASDPTDLIVDINGYFVP